MLKFSTLFRKELKVNIKDLDKIKGGGAVHNLYNKIEERVDGVTGEVTTIVSSFLKKERTKDEFIKLFAENIAFLVSDISNLSIKVFLLIIKNVNYQNIFKYDSDFVTYFVEHKIMSKASVYNALNELEEKSIILKITKEQKEEYDIIGSKVYIVNPQIIGKGSFRDLKKIRQTVTKTFDFEKLEMSQQLKVESSYDGLDTVLSNPDDFEITDVKQITSKNMVENQIIIDKKTNSLEDEKKISNDFVDKYAGMLNGVLPTTKTIKEIKRGLLDAESLNTREQNLKDGKL